jgi:hypothetical protein
MRWVIRLLSTIIGWRVHGKPGCAGPVITVITRDEALN